VYCSLWHWRRCHRDDVIGLYIYTSRHRDHLHHVVRHYGWQLSHSSSISNSKKKKKKRLMTVSTVKTAQWTMLLTIILTPEIMRSCRLVPSGRVIACFVSRSRGGGAGAEPASSSNELYRRWMHRSACHRLCSLHLELHFDGRALILSLLPSPNLSSFLVLVHCHFARISPMEEIVLPYAVLHTCSGRTRIGEQSNRKEPSSAFPSLNRPNSHCSSIRARFSFDEYSLPVSIIRYYEVN